MHKVIPPALTPVLLLSACLYSSYVGGGVRAVLSSLRMDGMSNRAEPSGFFSLSDCQMRSIAHCLSSGIWCIAICVRNSALELPIFFQLKDGLCMPEFWVGLG